MLRFMLQQRCSKKIAAGNYFDIGRPTGGSRQLPQHKC
jgi:hypothetical protein